MLINGEVKRPGIYDFDASFINNDFPGNYKDIPKGRVPQIYYSGLPFKVYRIDDVIRSANGITNNADLSKIVVVRKNSLPNGGGKIKGEFNFKESMIILFANFLMIIFSFSLFNKLKKNLIFYLYKIKITFM